MSVYVSTWCWQHSKASGVDLLTLLAIADQASDEGTDAWPCYTTLAKRIRKSEKTVQRSIQRLVDLGELAVERRGGPASCGQTHQRPNRYSFTAYRTWKTRQSDQSSPASDDPKSGQSDQSSGSKSGQNQQRVDTAMTCDPSFDPPISKPSSSEVDASASQATADAAAEERSRVEPEPRQDVDRLCTALRDHMIANDCRPPTITQGWRDSARLMLDKDDRQIDEALDLLAWVAHDEFWRANILSLPKFRAKYDQLRLRWQQTNPVRHLRSEEAITHWLRQQWREGMSRLVCDRSGLRYEPPTVLPAEVRSSAQANKWHEKQVRKWIEDNHSEIVRRIQERETPIGAAS